jgi:epoxyqueuosine reductase QueG
MTSYQQYLGNIQQELRTFLDSSPQNFVPELGRMRIYDGPLLAVASAADPLWESLKQPEVVGSHHMSPAQWLDGAKSVIAYFLPYTEPVRSANRVEGWPATEWLYGRYEGAVLNDALCSRLLDLLRQDGARALAPSLDPRFAVVNLRSNWSERHAAFITGLGTFSLSRSLITEAGSAGRFASVITDLSLEPTLRRYTEIDEYCTRCGACLRRCPPHAIAENGKDNAICAQYLKQTELRFHPRYGCGKCQAGVPCEAQRPPVSHIVSSEA